MREAMTRLSNSFVAYVCLLFGFAGLGTFVYAAATASPSAAALGVVMVGCFGASAMVFRAGARKLARTNESGMAIDGANVWAKPLRRAQVDHYLATYRRAEPATADDAAGHAPLPSRHRRHVSRNTNVSRSPYRGHRNHPERRRSPLSR